MRKQIEVSDDSSSRSVGRCDDAGRPLLVLGLSGLWTDPWLWAYLGVWFSLAIYAIASIGDDLARERFSPPEPGADRFYLRVIRLTAIAHLVLGALDVGRWHLFPVPSSLRVAGLVGCAIFGGLVFRSMVANRFFSAVVRIQNDRGHHVIDRGPYGLVRHPGYAGMILSIPCGGLALGSWLSVALAPGVFRADAETCDLRGCLPGRQSRGIR